MTYFQQTAAAAQRMEQARAARKTWVVTIPGKIELYEAPSQAAAEAMLTRSLRKAGYVAMPKQ
jgi:hypothetical protein